ncbi:hypothetical protein [Streptomyces regalis]|nr:hypothetical protein [Streptomyces regalis]
MAKVAERHGSTVRQIALAWLLASSTVALLAENMGAGSITLTPDDLSDLACP